MDEPQPSSCTGFAVALADTTLAVRGPQGIDVRRVIAIDGRLAYLSALNAVYDAMDGSVVWQGDTASYDGTVVGPHVVCTKGTQVYRAACTAPGTPRPAIEPSGEVPSVAHRGVRELAPRRRQVHRIRGGCRGTPLG